MQQIIIRNSAEPIQGNRYRWKIFAEVSDTEDTHRGLKVSRDGISSVSMELHPSFRPTKRILRTVAPNRFQSQYFTGWGTFEIPLTLTMNNGKELKFTHSLDFSEGGGYTEYTLEDDRKSCHCIRNREQLLEQVARISFTQHNSPIFWHGRLNCGEDEKLAGPQPPQVTWQSSDPPRHDHSAPTWLTASEYMDTATALQHKVAQLANLMRISEKTVIYSGAGISVTAGIGQASRGSAQHRGRNLSTTAQPTLTHYALADLSRNGLIHGWVQQNHDGLPQKAGFPQEAINEIHGSWYDPSNPVVKYSGSLRDYEFRWMEREADTADLVLVLGTSLSGLNADQVATEPACRSLKRKSLGMVIISPQQTPHDGEATLRIFGSSDDILSALLKELNIPMPNTPNRPLSSRAGTVSNLESQRVFVPYDTNGKRCTSQGRKMWLDLRPGASIRIVGHNIEGAQQPSQQVIVQKNNADGKIVRWDMTTHSIHLRVHGVSFQLGFWWVEAAKEGRVPTIPIVNCDPQYE